LNVGSHPAERRCLLAAVCLLALSTGALADPPDIGLKTPGVLAVCSYSEFQPVSYGDGKGYEADLLRGVARIWNIGVKFYPENVYEGIWRLPSRAYTLCDVSIGGISPTQAREREGAAFSVKTTAFRQSLLVRKADFDSGRITSYDSFRGKGLKIGVVPGTTGEQYAHVTARDHGVPASVFVQYPGEAGLLAALGNMSIDAIARGEIGNRYQQSLDPKFVTIATRDFGEGFAVAVDAGNRPLLRKLNEALECLTDHGKVDVARWLGQPDVFRHGCR
jgi:ABC-type amino acid transport substrate-binding protein